MAGQPGFFDVEDRLKQLSAKGDSLERLNAVVDFELFRTDLERAVPRADRTKGGRPSFDHVLMFKTLVLQTSHNLSDERTEYLIRDRLSFMRFLGLGLADTVPDANTIWGFREALTHARIAGRPAVEVVFERFDAVLATAGFLAMGGQIIDASIVAAPKQRNTEGEKRDIKRRPHSAGMGGKALQAAPEGPRRALDGQIHQGQTKRGRDAACRPRGPGLRVQKSPRHRSPAWSDPPPVPRSASPICSTTCNEWFGSPTRLRWPERHRSAATISAAAEAVHTPIADITRSAAPPKYPRLSA